ncbi:MAG: hypothetical protein PHH24_02275 [Candidatus Moranbacteria bacterium]|jgi:hypothetical protein|nr:hypothetical protein [Candidatus Moranbacteria bacterium]MDD5652407.1 hypothetical protein [Candidatus Moranbacteria bacterium]MDX9855450.1 hypothetical protein [Candidatus Moranbacteria bacterium]
MMRRELTKGEFFSLVAIIFATIGLMAWRFSEDQILAGANLFGTWALAPIGVIGGIFILGWIPYYYLLYLPRKALGYVKR